MAPERGQFRLRFWPTLGTLVGLALLLSLGTWQLTRYLEKIKLEEQRDAHLEESLVEADSLATFEEHAKPYNAVALRGELDPNYTFLFKHRVHDGKPGYWIGGVLRFAEGDGAVLVNRGWVHREEAHRVAELAPPAGEQTYVGVVHVPERIIADPPTRDALESGQLQLGRDITEWDTYDLEGISAALTLPHAGDQSGDQSDEPTIVMLGPDHSGDPYPIASVDYITEPYLTSERHLGYLLFWYATAIALLSMYLAYSFGYLGSFRHPAS